MPSSKTDRRHCVPVIYCKGTHYEVGFDVGRTFRGMIQEFVATQGPLNKIYIPLYETEDGKKAYDTTLNTCKKNFPQYVRELEGTADGAQVPFYKLFLLHMDDILPLSIERKGSDNCAGCSTITCNNPGQEILGHNEDALSETLNHWYIVSADITENQPQGKWQVSREKFTAVCYAGTLPGFCISYNHHGLAYSINIVSARGLIAGKTPRSFLTRSLLAVENMMQLQKVLRDSGTGAADGVSVNFTFLLQEGTRLFHNAEVAPDGANSTESAVNILTSSTGETIMHTNRYLRLKTPEVSGIIIDSSDHREKVISSLSTPKTKADVINVIGNNVDKEYPIYQELGPDDYVKTIMSGIFNCSERTLSVYTDNPRSSDPVVVLPVTLKQH